MSAEFILDVKIVISPKERLLYNRPYKTMVNHVSTAARLPIRKPVANGMIVWSFFQFQSFEWIFILSACM